VSRIQRFRPIRVAVVSSVAIAAMALAGCGAGQVTQTSTQVPAVVGASGNVGAVAVRDAHIEFAEQPQGAAIYPRGGAAPLSMSIINSGGEPDRLVSASSPVADSVQISGNADIPAGRLLIVEGGGAEAPVAAPTAAAGPTPAAPAGSAGPTPAAPAGPTTAVAPSANPNSSGDEVGGSGLEGEPALSSPVPTPPLDGPAEVPERGAQVVLTGLKENIQAGVSYPLVLNFERAGQVTVQVPVGYPSEPREDAHAE
jgi:copper(I)-binding protein